MQLLRQFLVQYNGSPPAQTGGLFHFIHVGFRGVKGIVDPDMEMLKRPEAKCFRPFASSFAFLWRFRFCSSSWS